MTWRQDNTGVKPGGDVGGDHQVTESYSVRYLHSSRSAVVTVSGYGVERSRGRYGVEMQTEMTVCISALFSYQPDTGFTFTLGLVSLRDGTSTQTAKSVTDLVELVGRGEASFVALAPAVFAGQSELDGVAAELRKGGPR